MSLPAADAERESAVAEPGWESYPRHLYPYKQLIAYENGLMRFDHLDFALVQFFDISCSGFSFLIRGLPRGENIVAQLGQKPNLLLVRARVANVAPREHEGAWMMLVHCNVIGRWEDPRF
ncbi:MAG TPA: hypothetical protein VFE24_05305 [Pirellulales bacterium]|jgi:hypothetical protein|nr:hypothetical protein [Pirellulales bacterium]